VKRANAELLVLQYNDSSSESCQDSSFKEVHIRVNCYLCLNNTDCLSVFPLSFSIFRRPKRNLYERFFLVISRVTGAGGFVIWTTTVGNCRQNAEKS